MQSYWFAANPKVGWDINSSLGYVVLKLLNVSIFPGNRKIKYATQKTEK
jgi:hypothetical protein